MAARALIIAVEKYPILTGGGITQSLPGTLKAGLDFKDWLSQKWVVEGRPANETQVLFCSEPEQPGFAPATSRAIRKALLTLKQDGQNSTEELYVFFSGHGFSFVEKPGSRADVIITSDFETAELSPGCCLNLDELVSWLRLHLGPGRHYYFVDACRNSLTAEQIQVGPLLPIDPQAAGEASTFVLQSTVEGAVAAVGGTFPAALIAGLKGKGKAKTWNPTVSDAMFVRYDSLRGYLKTASSPQQKITSRTAGSDGESDAVLAIVRPIPRSTCKIEISNAPMPLKGEISYRRGRSNLEERRPINSNPINLCLEPDDYTISVRIEGAALKPRDPLPVDLYDDRNLNFERVFEEMVSAPAEVDAVAVADVDVVVPDQSLVTLKNVATGLETRVYASGPTQLTRGRYLATLRNTGGQIFLRREIELAPGEQPSLNLAEWQTSAPHIAIASRLPQSGGGVDFSESLEGAVTDPDLDLWLALLGGGRILGSVGDYSKLARFPLHEFGNEPPDASPIYVLAGFEKPTVELKVGMSQTAKVTWLAAKKPTDMLGIREAYFARPPGPCLVSFRIGDQAPYTIASLASRNRAMLITLTVDDEGDARVSQYLLPIGHLINKLATDVANLLQGRNFLKDVRFLAQASRAFRKRRDVRTAIPPDELDALLDAKWLDPIGSSLAAYEFLRRGKPARLDEVVTNLQRFFDDLPDTAALATLTGRVARHPAAVPLFFDGLRAYPDYASWLPLPASHLDFASPWTAWRAAVEP